MGESVEENKEPDLACTYLLSIGCSAMFVGVVWSAKNYE